MTRFNEQDIKKMLVNVVNEVYPFYEEVRPWVSVYDKRHCTTEHDKVRLEVNYDFFGYIEDHDGQLVADARGWRTRTSKEVTTIEEGIRFCVKFYFHH